MRLDPVRVVGGTSEAGRKREARRARESVQNHWIWVKSLSEEIGIAGTSLGTGAGLAAQQLEPQQPPPFVSPQHEREEAEWDKTGADCAACVHRNMARTRIVRIRFAIVKSRLFELVRK